MKKPVETTLPVPSPDNSDPDLWTLAAGSLPARLTNDYLFRALLQKNNSVLKGLICSLLHLPPENIHSAVITNKLRECQARYSDWPP